MTVSETGPLSLIGSEAAVDVVAGFGADGFHRITKSDGLGHGVADDRLLESHSRLLLEYLYMIR